MAAIETPVVFPAESLARFLTAARESKLGLGTLQALALLEDEEPHSLINLARRCGVAASSMTQVAARLDGMGLASRENARGDRRVTFLTITPAGLQTLRNLLTLA